MADAAVDGDIVGGYFLRKRGNSDPSAKPAKSSSRGSKEGCTAEQDPVTGKRVGEDVSAAKECGSVAKNTLRLTQPPTTCTRPQAEEQVNRTPFRMLQGEHEDETFSTPQAPDSAGWKGRQQEGLDAATAELCSPFEQAVTSSDKQEEPLLAQHKLAAIEARLRDVQGELEQARPGGSEQQVCSEENNSRVHSLKARLLSLEEELSHKDEELQSMATQSKELEQALRDAHRQQAAAAQLIREALKTSKERADEENHQDREASDDKDLVRLVTDFREMHTSLRRRFQEEAAERRKLHNTIVDMKGAIRVFCRVRPRITGAEAAAPMAVECNVNDSSISVSSGRVGGTGRSGVLSTAQKAYHFSFDAVFGPAASQEEVFVDAAPVVASVLDGYSVCIFAYGQTGSGKTWTMEGPAEEHHRGVNYRALGELFRLAHSRQAECEFDIHLSMTEVYMEQIMDLLAEEPGARLDVKQGPHGSYLPGLTEAHIAGVEQAWTYLKRGQRNRRQAATHMNDASSRSHCLLCLRVHGRSKVNGDTWRAKLWLCDLAGSERVSKSAASGERLKEAQFINKSLSSLGDCINALAKQAPHVPYRNSKLTYMLQSSLSGRGKTLMFVNVAPGMADAGETLCSLQFAARVRGVELGPARRHVEAGSEIGELRAELAALKAQVAAAEQERSQIGALLSEREADASALLERLRCERAAHARDLASAASRATLSARGQQERAAASAPPARPPTQATAADHAPLETPALKLPPLQKPGQAFASPPPASTQGLRMPPPCLPPASAFLRRNGRSAASSYRRPTVAPAAMAAIPASVPKLPMSAFKGSVAYSASRSIEAMRRLNHHAAETARARKPSNRLFSGHLPGPGAPTVPLSPLSARPHHIAEAAAKPVSRGHLKENAAAAATSTGAATAGGKADYMEQFRQFKEARSIAGRPSIAGGASRIIKKGGRPQPVSLQAERMQQPQAKRHPLLQI